MNDCDEEKNTPLHLAAKAEKFEIVKFLIEEIKVNPHCRNLQQDKPIDVTHSI